MAIKSASNYEKKNTVIDAMDPVVKYIGVLILGCSTIVFPYPILAYVICILLVFAAYKAEFLLPFLQFILKFGIPVLLMLLIIQGIFNPHNETVLFEIKTVRFYEEGFVFAFKIVGTLLVFLGSFWLASKTTDTGRMVAALERVGISGYVGYLILATLNVIPQMQNRMRIVKNAQNARGLETEGNILKRAKAFIPLIGPVIMSSLIDVQERGMTLELRGFTIKNIKKTRLIVAEETKTDKKIKAALFLYGILIVLISIALRLMEG